ncbi:MAG: hypothetical protein ACI9KN_002416 [Gammaproteobacteria bacterium]|jgi:uncharacterized protein YbgA (DUF1722 family)/uncharacterized protein YbbK (DUF523 family)
MHKANSDKIKIGISSCLMGERVRFDTGHKRNAYINAVLTPYFEFTSFCPEVEIGLGTPRAPLRLVTFGDEVRCVGTRDPELDVTQKLYQAADQSKSWHKHLSGYILKKDSPSCGMERVRLYKGDTPGRKGVGLYADRMMQNFPDLPVEEEGRLEDPVLRENFIQRVYIYRRWQDLMEEPFSIRSVEQFHARHKYIYMSHDPLLARELGAWLAQNQQTDLPTLAAEYLSKAMTLLKQTATRKGHTNTLQHIQGYLREHLTADDRLELTTNIDEYRKGLLPLIVPITLLRHYFRHHPNNYIDQSYYMQPHPAELSLLNNL